MKNLLIAISTLLLTNSYGQTSTDRIVLHTGEELAVNILGISERSVTYNYPEESVEYTKSKNSIDEIIFVSGRRSKGSEKIHISNTNDWQKVVLTNNPEDVIGLSKKGDLYQKSIATTIFSGSQRIDAKATRKIKQHAAALGAHIIYIQDQTTDKGIRRVNRSIKSGVAYGYF
jgi:hypothetical protein